MEREFDVKDKEKVYRPIQIKEKKGWVRNRVAVEKKMEREHEFVVRDWVILKSRKNFLNKKYTLSLACLFEDDKRPQGIVPIVVLSVNFKDGEIKSLTLIKDDYNLFYEQQKEIISAVKQHLRQEEKVEEVINSI